MKNYYVKNNKSKKHLHSGFLTSNTLNANYGFEVQHAMLMDDQMWKNTVILTKVGDANKSTI